jgi:FMN phosphatase YigB (HAD superfamily)
MLKAVFFDLDGTLLYMDEPKFLEIYFRAMGRWIAENGLDADRLIEGTKVGTRAMFKNDGSATNEEVFFKGFEEYLGEVTKRDIEVLDTYYDSAFEETFAACKPNPYSRGIVKACREMGLKVILSTNPLFPRVATLKRMALSGLAESDFDLVTAYENSSFCKPNPRYFHEIMKKFNLKADEVIVFGNNTYDDGECALMAGLRCYIIESENLIESEKSTHNFERIKITNVINTVKKHIEE